MFRLHCPAPVGIIIMVTSLVHGHPLMVKPSAEPLKSHISFLSSLSIYQLFFPLPYTFEMLKKYVCKSKIIERQKINEKKEEKEQVVLPCSLRNLSEWLSQYMPCCGWNELSSAGRPSSVFSPEGGRHANQEACDFKRAATQMRILYAHR